MKNGKESKPSLNHMNFKSKHLIKIQKKTSTKIVKTIFWFYDFCGISDSDVGLQNGEIKSDDIEWKGKKKLRIELNNFNIWEFNRTFLKDCKRFLIIFFNLSRKNRSTFKKTKSRFQSFRKFPIKDVRFNIIQ